MEQFSRGVEQTQAKLPADGVQRIAESVSAPLSIRGGDGVDAFSDVLGKMVKEVNAKQAAAATSVEGSMTGENVPLHQTMLAIEEASVAFQLMVEVRNKLLESYQELMRMQV